MVKPTFNTNQDGLDKGDIKKEKDIEASVKNDSGVETQVVASHVAAPARKRHCCFCWIMLSVLMFAVVVIGAFSTFALMGYGRGRMRCGVTYDMYREEDADYLPSADLLQEFIMEDVDIDVANELELIDKPADEFSEQVTIMHDYKVNISAYHLLFSKTCYVKTIDPEVIANPKEFWENIQDPAFFTQHFEMLYETYIPIEPAITDLQSLGPNIAALCYNVPTYWLLKLPRISLADILNMLVDSFGEFEERQRRDLSSLEEDVKKIRYFGGKKVLDIKVLPTKYIPELKKAGMLPKEYNKLTA